jgi:hypothetical protein
LPIEFKTKTPEQKKLYESKVEELGCSNSSEMIRNAIDQLIDDLTRLLLKSSITTRIV